MAVKLSGTSALVIGAGGLGGPAALALAAGGVGRLVLLDEDEVELSNLNRQPLFGDADLGRRKAAAAAARISLLHPAVKVEGRDLRFGPDCAEDLVRGCDVVVDASDNFATRFLANDVALAARRPLVHGAVLRYTAQFLTVMPGKTGCLRCLFEAPPRRGDGPHLRPGRGAGGPGRIRRCADGGRGPAPPRRRAGRLRRAARGLRRPLRPVAPGAAPHPRGLPGLQRASPPRRRGRHERAGPLGAHRRPRPRLPGHLGEGPHRPLAHRRGGGPRGPAPRRGAARERPAQRGGGRPPGGPARAGARGGARERGGPGSSAEPPRRTRTWP